KIVRYTGEQIQVTDEYGNPLDNNIRYEIYCMAMKDNPHIYWVKIYLSNIGQNEDVIKVRYNHIESVVDDYYTEATEQTLELYANNKNELEGRGQTKKLIEGGKLRILN